MTYNRAFVSFPWKILSLAFIGISFPSSKWIPPSLSSGYKCHCDAAATDFLPITELGKAFFLATRANLYGYPLLEGVRLAKTMTSVNCTSSQGYAPINVFSHRDDFEILTAAPNVDVLYAPVILDLTKGPVIIQHPDMGERYFSFQLTDPYTNVIGYLGSRTTGSTAARFAIRWKNDNTTGHTHLTNIKETITVDYSGIFVLGRILVNDPEYDLKAVIKLLQQFIAIPPGGQIKVPKCKNDTQFYQYKMPFGVNFYKELNNALALFPPPKIDTRIMRQLSSIGVGRYAITNTLNRIIQNGRKRRALIAANLACVPGLKRTIELTKRRKRKENNGWRKTPSNVGKFGTDYVTRAGTAIVGFGANSPDEAFYQAASYDSNGSLLRSDRSYQLVFPPGYEPPVNQFWSITLYKLDYTVPMNVLEPIYSIASKKSNFVRQSNGTVVIHISRTKPYEATTIPKTVNWLPSQLSTEYFYIMLRCYHPKESVLNYTWKAPGIQRLTAGKLI
jgi:hypothetical protein